jgi:hypothetical protein
MRNTSLLLSKDRIRGGLVSNVLEPMAANSDQSFYNKEREIAPRKVFTNKDEEAIIGTVKYTK